MDNEKTCRDIYDQLVKTAASYQPGDKQAEQVTKELLLNVFRDALSDNRYNYEELRNCLRRSVTTRMEREPDGQTLLAKVRFWLEDEIILICPKSEAYIRELRRRFKDEREPAFVLRDFRNNRHETPLPPSADSPLYIDIEFKSEYIKASKAYHTKYEAHERDPISLVTQAMFLVGHHDGMFYTLHDRSFSGADDRLSKYAMITGRLAAQDVSSAIPDTGIPIKLVCQHTLFRELQELDELGLSADTARHFTHHNQVDGINVQRTDFVGIYEARDGKVLSVLFAIYVTVDEYNAQLTQRGPYLIPVTPQEFSKFRTLHLLNDILHLNSCSSCRLDTRHGTSACQVPGNPCIIRDINDRITPDMLAHFDVLDYDTYRDTNISQYHMHLGENSAIVAIDIPDHSRLDSTTTHRLRREITYLITSYFSSDADYVLPLRATSTGYIQILQMPANAKPIPLALIAYFLAIYISRELTRLKQLRPSAPDVRLALHMDSLQQFGEGERAYFTGNGINRTLDIVNVGQPRQILSSFSFVMHLLAELEMAGIDLLRQPNAELYYRDSDKANLFTPDELAALLQRLDLPDNVILDLYKDPSLTKCYQEQGLPISDFGFFVQANGLRYRVFNLGVFTPAEPSPDNDGVELKLPDYGNLAQPTARIPIVSRNTNTTISELERLVEGVEHAEHLMMYGYSNVRMMREIFKWYVRSSEPRPTALKSFKIVFYDFAQYQEINETRKIVITQANWVRGFLYAQYVARALRRNKNRNTDTKIVINSMRYGFNVLKVIYAACANPEYKDHIRFTVPMPGQAFELSPVFIINRGDPLYSVSAEISEKYVEKGIRENSATLAVTEYLPNAQGDRLLNRLFDAPLPRSLGEADETRYIELVQTMKRAPGITHAVAETELGDHYADLLGEYDFAEALRLQYCIDLLEDDHYSTDGKFDIHRFLSDFRA